jgi:hypothetical protein
MEREHYLAHFSWPTKCLVSLGSHNRLLSFFVVNDHGVEINSYNP